MVWVRPIKINPLIFKINIPFHRCRRGAKTWRRNCLETMTLHCTVSPEHFGAKSGQSPTALHRFSANLEASFDKLKTPVANSRPPPNTKPPKP